MSLYLDPSINAFGWAFFRDGYFCLGDVICTKEQGFDRLLEIADNTPGTVIPSKVVVEWPHYRAGGAVRATPSDLILIGAAAGAFLGAMSRWCRKVEALTPQEWKGQLPKSVTHAHMWKVLTEEEKKLVEAMRVPSSKVDNLYDAICIGLYCEGRAPWKKPEPTTTATRTARKKRSSKNSTRSPNKSKTTSTRPKTPGA